MEFTKHQIEKIKNKAKKEWLDNQAKKEKRILEQKAQDKKWGFDNAQKIMKEGATISNNDKYYLRQSEHKRGTRTPASDNLEHGKKYGHIHAKTGRYRAVA